MSQQSNRKQVVVYNYDPHPQQNILREQPQNIQQSRITEESPFNVSRILKAKQQSSNIFNLPTKDLIDMSQVRQQNDMEKILPQNMFWWNTQNLKDNKKVQIKEEPIQSPFEIIQKHNQLIETASFPEKKQQQPQQQQQSQSQVPNQIQPITDDNYQLQNLSKLDEKVNNPNTKLKQKNQHFSDIFGNGLEQYYQDHQNKGNKPKTADLMQESEVYGQKYHQRQQLRGMSSAMDTHNYYDQALDQQNKDLIKARNPSAPKSAKSSPGKHLQQDQTLFPKPIYTQITIRGMGSEINWEKLNNILVELKMLLVDVTTIKDKQQKIKQHKIIIKHYDINNMNQAKQWIVGQGGRIVEDSVIPSEEEFLKILKLKEGPKQKPIKIAQEKQQLQEQRQKKRPQSAVTINKNPQRPQSAIIKRK